MEAWKDIHQVVKNIIQTGLTSNINSKHLITKQVKVANLT